MNPARPTTSRAQRDLALDFTKGFLVFTMVLYHWMNYFIVTEYDVYRYLRFLTPSFIFITGFLISHAYLPRYQPGDPRLSKRLIQRGLKILGVFVLLNFAITVLAPAMGHWRMPEAPFSIQHLTAIYVTGNVMTPGGGKAASFAILVPIAYLLLLSAALLMLSKRYRHIFQWVTLSALFLVFVLYLRAIESPNLELLAIGLLGVICGHASTETINRLASRPGLVIGANLVYLAAITVWGVNYPIQIVGVCLNLMLIYLLGSKVGGYAASKPVIVAGKYSLFAYIGQLAIIQALRGVPWYMMLDAARLPISLIAAFCLTTLLIEVLDRARARTRTVDRMYSAVFS